MTDNTTATVEEETMTQSAGPILERLEHMDILLYKLTTKSHLAIGAGETAELAPVDKPVIRAMIYQGEKDEFIPYIPASSIHGVVRSWVEKVLRSQSQPLPVKDKFKAFKKNEDGDEKKDYANQLWNRVKHDLGIDSKIEETPELIDKIWNEWRLYKDVCNIFWEHDRCQPRDDKPEAKAIAAWLKHIGRGDKCPVCRLFGHTGQRGRVRFSHAFPGDSSFRLDIITRVAINRHTGAADDGKLFDMEAVPPNVAFHFFVMLENMTAAEINTVRYGFRAMELQLATLGAHSTVGFGMVELENPLHVILKPEIFSKDPALFQFDKTKMPTNYAPARYPDFFNFLAGLTKAPLPTDLEKCIEIKSKGGNK